MRSHRATRLAAGIWLLTIALIAATGAMKAAGWHGAGDTSTSGLVALDVAFVVFATMGAFVAARVPTNPLGWIFLAIALTTTLGGVAENYAFHGLVHDPGSLPGALFAGWLYAWTWEPAIGLILMVPLLYPTGTLPGRRWRWVLWGEIALYAVVTASYMFGPGALGDSVDTLPDNPVGIGAVGRLADHLGPVLGLGFAGSALAAVVAMVVRFRGSRGDERQQLKWMTLAVVLLVVGFGLPELLGIKDTGDVLFSIGIIQLPVVVGVAMLKYRLYDVDRVINRTLVYGVLTAILGATYFGLVLGAQALFSSFAGGSHLAIAGSTLVVAALFLPARRRVQRFVDRRFYRRRYDAQRTLERFGARLREEVELETLAAELRHVVQETMQPAGISLWLSETPR